MLTRFLFLLITICFIANAQAQGKGRIYNGLINEAELYIVDGQYKEALTKYDEAFRDIEFAADLYNACVCAVKLGDRSRLLHYSGKLTGKGVGAKFFTRHIFNGYAADKDFAAIVNGAEKIRKDKLAANEDYNIALKKFITLDSTYNKLRLTKYRDAPGLPDTLENLFRVNTKGLLDCIVKSGYYTEDKMGADIGSDTIIKHVRKPDLVFLHYLGMGSDKVLLDDIKKLLLDNLDKGNIKPYHITGIIELANNIFGDTGSWLYNIYDCKLYRKIDVEEQESINRMRELYCMGSLEEFDKKIIYRYSTSSDFDFKYNVIKSSVHDTAYFESAFRPIAAIKNCE